MQLLRQPSFIPTAQDFESFVTICLFKKTQQMLKTFLQSFQMQYIFCSYPMDIQKRIVRMLLGLSPDGKEAILPIFEHSVTLKRPYQAVSALILLESRDLIQKATMMATELLTSMTTLQIVLLPYLDRDLIMSVVSEESQSGSGANLIGKSAEQSQFDSLMRKFRKRIYNECKEQGLDLMQGLGPFVQHNTMKSGTGFENPVELQDFYEVDHQKSN